MFATTPDYAEAVRFLTAAVALRPDSGMTHLKLAGALQFNGQLDEAIVSVNKAIELNPKFKTAHFNLACYSAMSAVGTGEIADSERVRLRKQALNSLRIALSLVTDQIDNDILVDRE